MIEPALGTVGVTALLAGLGLATIGLYGMLRRSDIFEQLHAAGLVTGSAVILVLIASVGTGAPEIVTSAFLVLAFVLVTSSLSTHAIALAAWRRREGTASSTTMGRSEGQRVAHPVAGWSWAAAMRVLVAHDGSPGAEVAVNLARTMPWPDGSAIRVVAAIEGYVDPLGEAERNPGEQREQPAEVAAALEAAVRTLGRPGLAVDHVARRGDPATAIIEEAVALGADLVIMGSRGLGRVASLFVDSVAAAVIDGAPCQVLVARSPRVGTVLLATDGSEASAAATEVVERWPIFAGLPVHVLSVATAAAPYGDLPATSGLREGAQAARHRKIADAAAIRLLEAGRRAVSHVRSGEAAAVIIGLAETEAVDLVVLGTRGRTGLKRTLLGSVARDVLSSARGSVLVIRARRP